jgi:hypothetical protein
MASAPKLTRGALARIGQLAVIRSGALDRTPDQVWRGLKRLAQ